TVVPPGAQPAQASQPAATVPSAATAPAQAAAPAATVASTPPTGADESGSPADASTLIDKVKLTSSDLPQGFSLGQFAASEQNPQATTGFDNPPAVLSLLNSTGRQIGYIQQVITPDSSSGAGIEIGVWGDAAGAKSWMDQYPSPAGDM